MRALETLRAMAILMVTSAERMREEKMTQETRVVDSPFFLLFLILPKVRSRNSASLRSLTLRGTLLDASLQRASADVRFTCVGVVCLRRRVGKPMWLTTLAARRTPSRPRGRLPRCSSESPLKTALGGVWMRPRVIDVGARAGGAFRGRGWGENKDFFSIIRK